ncbi:uncharacterized protein A1O9_00468 [Exophiala aquamarina CBS 119918]|uniref:Uncharacterized protein n=1 Tax=Exophiala aquamarina CBS 119918 TaxID=1182545 RepID=A0A072Q3L1_9EURO|nr:uncharacterized protein A1O9_00468 [Exophiala aquamarina CBS 119918]KEF62495.1 hypothetical protein A1O9_00468 [Exophiala aquamarina CBS 119918]
MAPILTILVGQYWTRDERPLRTAIWWSGSATGGFIADAITHGVSGKSLSNSKYGVWRVVSNQTGVENRQYKWHQVKEGLMDRQPWLLALNAFLQCLQGGGLVSVRNQL